MRARTTIACSSGMFTLWQIRLRNSAGGISKALSFMTNGWKHLYGQQAAGVTCWFLFIFRAVGESCKDDADSAASMFIPAVFLPRSQPDAMQVTGALTVLVTLMGDRSTLLPRRVGYLPFILSLSSMLSSFIGLAPPAKAAGWVSLLFVNLWSYLLNFEW